MTRRVLGAIVAPGILSSCSAELNAGETLAKQLLECRREFNSTVITIAPTLQGLDPAQALKLIWGAVKTREGCDERAVEKLKG